MTMLDGLRIRSKILKELIADEKNNLMLMRMLHAVGKEDTWEVKVPWTVEDGIKTIEVDCNRNYYCGIPADQESGWYKDAMCEGYIRHKEGFSENTWEVTRAGAEYMGVRLSRAGITVRFHVPYAENQSDSDAPDIEWICQCAFNKNTCHWIKDNRRCIVKSPVRPMFCPYQDENGKVIKCNFIEKGGEHHE